MDSTTFSVVFLEVLALVMGGLGVMRYRQSKTVGQRKLARLLIIMAGVSVSPKTGRWFKVELSPGIIEPVGSVRRRYLGEEETAVYCGVQGPGGSGGFAGG